MVGGIRSHRICHLSECRLVQFFDAMSESQKGLGPLEFFSDRELRRILACPRCVFVVMTVYDLTVQFLSSQELIGAVERETRFGIQPFFQTSKNRQRSFALA